jgi:hypothetical protein
VPRFKTITRPQDPTQEVEFRWVDQPPAGTQVEYVFEASSGKGIFDNGAGTWTTTQATVHYFALGDFEGLEVVQATALDQATGEELAKANATFRVTRSKVFIQPHLASLKAGESQHFATGFAPDPDGAESYSYRILEGGGSLDRGEDVLVQTPGVTYTAASSEGTAKVEVTGYRVIDGRWQEVNRDVATIRLEERKSVVQGSWTIEVLYETGICGNCGPGGTPIETTSSSATAYAVVPKLPGVKSYRVVLEDPTGDPAGGIFFPRTYPVFTPESLGSWHEKDGVYRSGLSAGGGPDDWAVTAVSPWLHARFDDMAVTVEVTYE